MSRSKPMPSGDLKPNETKLPRGRPTVTGEKRSVARLVRCTPDELERWQGAADAKGVTLPDVAREAWERLARKGL